MIEIKQVSKVFTGATVTHALKDIQLHIERGDIFGIIGFSGAGKSTLLRCINKLEVPTEGAVLINKVDIATLNEKELRQCRKKIGMIFQHFNLLSAKTVYDNVAMPLYLDGQSKQQVQAKVKEILDFVGLTGKEDVYPGQLSGGQKQRVGIARALVTDPDILLCDEATSSLDPETTATILELLKRINRKYGITIVLITHEMSVIRDLCSKVAVMEDGMIVEQGSVYEVFTNAEHAVTKNFVNTVLQHDYPASYSKHLLNQKLYRFIFRGDKTAKPLLSEVSRQFDIRLNILYGSIIELQSQPYGNLIVALEGAASERDKTLAFIEREGVEIKEVAV
ncbi:methionine ABC transporter ATP-binding protein [Paenibacillus sp. 481]|uniref:methionine ABC transporter ATP-binding protein n=1 Tax=Paenibacillus sp. 481 TaxID=2835869 RepID=UPI001E4D2B35|nr:ATP-binding cassette domain-containing protein [Paenibacillus sp. 481]UHA73023.1 ATP-binding cassette domain-containing protein [Paenibacillus sp. 481]